MAARSRSVTFEDEERSDESDHEDGDDYFGEPSDDEDEDKDKEADRMQNDEDLALLEQLLN